MNSEEIQSYPSFGQCLQDLRELGICQIAFCVFSKNTNRAKERKAVRKREVYCIGSLNLDFRIEYNS